MLASCHEFDGQQPHCVALPTALCDPALQAAVRRSPAPHLPQLSVSPLAVRLHVDDVKVGGVAPASPTVQSSHTSSKWSEAPWKNPEGQAPHTVGSPKEVFVPAAHGLGRFCPLPHVPQLFTSLGVVARHARDVYVGGFALALPCTHDAHALPVVPSVSWKPVGHPTHCVAPEAVTPDAAFVAAPALHVAQVAIVWLVLPW